MKIKRKEYRFYNPTLDQSIRIDRQNYWVKTVDLGYAHTSYTDYAGSGQYGRTVTSRRYDARDIVIEGWITADNKKDMLFKKRQLQNVVNPMDNFNLIINEEYEITCMCDGSIKYSPLWYINNEYLCYWSIDIVCEDPFFRAYGGEKDAQLAGWTKDFHFVHYNPVGERFIFGHRQLSTLAMVENVGEVPTGLKITLTAINGDLVRPYIRNVDTGEYLRLNMTLPQGESVVINTGYASKSAYILSSGQNVMNKVTLGSTFLTLGLGYSVFDYGADNTSTGIVDCRFAYMPRYLEV